MKNCPTEIVVSDSQGRWSKLKPDGSNDVMKKGTVLPNDFLRRMKPEDRPTGRAGMTTYEGQAKYAKGQEKSLQRDCCNLLRQRNIFFRQMPFGRKPPKGWAGWSDIFAMLPDGTALFLETKAGDEVQTKEQIDFENELLEKTDCIHRVIRNLTQLQDLINYAAPRNHEP